MTSCVADRDEWIKIGFVGVDAGLIHIGDPCYLTEDREDVIDKVGLGRNYAKEWDKFCDWLQANQDKFQNAIMPYPMGHEGRAIIVGGFGGDGTYGVYMRRRHGYFGNVTAQVLIDFAGDMENNEEEKQDVD